MAKTGKQRLDQVLVERRLADSRSRAQALVMAGLVFSQTKRLDKPGHRVAADIPLTVRGPDHPWASRGGIKLAHGLDHFGIEPAARVCLDIGASSGGFTDVLLCGGAAKVYAVDVGHGQLDWKPRRGERVVVLDKTGTLTEGQPRLTDVIGVEGFDAAELLALVDGTHSIAELERLLDVSLQASVEPERHT